MEEKLAEFLIDKYVKKGNIIGIGTSKEGEAFLKKLSEKKYSDLKIKIVPTSTKLAGIIASFGLNISNISEKEVDIAIEFVDLADEEFNFIKRDSHSLIRDKMIGQSAAELIIVLKKKNLVKKLFGKIPYEIVTFGWRRTLIQLENYGNATLRKIKGQPKKSETGNYFVDVDIADIFSLEDLEFKSKEIPGVIESGLFIGYADRLVLIDEKKIKVKSRIQKQKKN